MSDVNERLQRYERRKGARQPWDTEVEQILNYILPRKSQVISEKSPGVEEYSNRIYNDTAQDANEVLASGLVTNTTPVTEMWMAFDAPAVMRKNADEPVAADWFSKVNERTMEALAASNVYNELHELHLERNTACTACIYVEEGRQTALNFRTIPWGTYVFGENDEGTVDDVQVEFKLTARQAVQKFGYENLGERVQKAYDEPLKRDEEFCFVHSVYPRMERDGNSPERSNKPFASCYDCKEDKKEVQEGGYDEMPYIVTRFLRWPGYIWGFGPGIRALPTVRQVNEIERNMDVLAEVAAFPRMLIPSGMVKTVDLAAGGVTPVDESAGQNRPEEWLTNGRYDIGKDRVEIKDKAIRRAFYNDLFQMLGNMEPGRLTAYEVMQRVAEKLEQFTPAFQRITSELLRPLALRVFGILARAGVYPDFPEELMVPVGADKEGQPIYSPALPSVNFQSKMALAIRALENKNFVEYLQIIAPLIGTNPEVLDPIKLVETSRRIARNLNLNSSLIRTDDELAEIAESRAEAQQAAQQAEMVAMGAKAAGDMGKAPPGMLEKAGMA